MITTRIAALYAAFAGIATLANLASQAAAIRVYQGRFAVELSILVGTLVGLPIKYALDKRYIFRFRTASLAHDGRLLLIYGFTGVLTTLLFWSVEYAFHWWFGSDGMRYLGGAIGLALGYVVKYGLDRRFVFVTTPFGYTRLRSTQKQGSCKP